MKPERLGLNAKNSVNSAAHSNLCDLTSTEIYAPSTKQLHLSIMGIPFDYAQDRPENIDTILNGLDRYNPETTGVFQEYVDSQCENKTYDCYANLALLKL